MAELWDVFAECLKATAAQCTFIITNSIDNLSTSNTAADKDDGAVVIQKLNGLVNADEMRVKVLLTACLKSAHIPWNENNETCSVVSLMEPKAYSQSESFSSLHRFTEIQERRTHEIAFDEITMLYPPRTIIYTKQDGELHGYMVLELSGMEVDLNRRHSSLHIRAVHVDHNGTYFAWKHCQLIIPPFSGRKAITTLKYVPTGYLPDEAVARAHLIARGRTYWVLSQGVHYKQIGWGKVLTCPSGFYVNY
jgi:hypothetical protein